MPFLLRCRLTKYAVSPPGSGVPHARAMSPAPLGSSLITRAPKSASMVEQKGPARAWLRSMTVTSSSGRRMWFVSSRAMVAQAAAAVGCGGFRYRGSRCRCGPCTPQPRFRAWSLATPHRSACAAAPLGGCDSGRGQSSLCPAGRLVFARRCGRPCPHPKLMERLCWYLLLRPPPPLERLSETAPALDESNGSPKPCSIPQIQFRKADWLGVRRSQRDQRAINPGLEFCKVERVPLGPPPTLQKLTPR